MFSDGALRLFLTRRYQLSVVSYQLSVISYQLSVISCQLSVVSYQLSKAMMRDLYPPPMP